MKTWLVRPHRQPTESHAHRFVSRHDYLIYKFTRWRLSIVWPRFYVTSSQGCWSKQQIIVRPSVVNRV